MKRQLLSISILVLLGAPAYANAQVQGESNTVLNLPLSKFVQSVVCTASLVLSRV